MCSLPSLDPLDLNRRSIYNFSQNARIAVNPTEHINLADQSALIAL